MRFNQLISSSRGNAYALTSAEGTRVGIEAGCSIKALTKLWGHSLPKVFLITHEHMDHAKGVEGLQKRGVDIYASTGTIDALGLTGHRIHAIEARERFSLEGFNVVPFETEHDAAEPLGFVITDTVDRLLFATDTGFLQASARGLTKVAIECNYFEEALEDLEPTLRRRIRRTHMGLCDVIRWFDHVDTRALESVDLLHISDARGDVPRFVREVSKRLCVPVYTVEDHQGVLP